MEIIYFLLPLALLIALGFLAAYIWALKSGQYDDLDTPAYRMLLDYDQQTKNDKNHA